MKFNSTLLLLTTLLLALGFSQFSLHAQESPIWTEPVQISTNSNRSPKIGVLGTGKPAVIWGSGSNIFFSKMVDSIFTDPQIVSTEGNSPDIYFFGGIDLAIQGNIIYIVFENFFNGVFIIKSEDAGESFLPPVNVYDPVPGMWATLPSVEIDQNGFPVVGVILEKTNETQGTYIVMRSLDGGSSFESPVTASEPAEGDYVCECCPADIQIEGENLWLVFRNNNSNIRDMWASKSTNGGGSFEMAVDLDDTNWMLNACPISGPQVTPMAEDSLFTFWMSGALGSNRVYYSTFDGNEMTKGIEMKMPLANEGSQQHPDVAGANGHLGLVWTENGFPATGSDILFTYSKDGLDSLNNNIINLSPTEGNQSLPALAYDSLNFHLVYNDGAGGLQYRSGQVPPPPIVNSGIGTNLYSTPFELVNQPLKNGLLKIKGPPYIMIQKAILRDGNGQIVHTWSQAFNDSNGIRTFSVPPLSNGMYYLSILTSQGNFHLKVIQVQ